MKYGLKDSILENLVHVFAKYPKIEKVLLYGSRAKGNYKNGSDIDLTLIGENLDLQDLNKVSLDLDELYLPYSFDLSIFENIENEELIEHISRIGVTIYERPVRC
ncbi:Nucleotidyltransferase domain-containing protein [Geosporobacter subterraneus DSM 17957]|uniref:Nucleotidyltransferase domain-containing protein n=1 Tax=Geosporobacter subterraneus DSM 17957 TaxID=1121919 RepID=A0A1M6CP07_9FIRM|nr:nucleotidyltransferase domain-containing protein [Geosporobacter subterraneus]SHI62633.1 Nucleotidyltransferase domain-containing protein [Geosporobacter subterraneus DSM 17957]